jgi:hypothetical protein
MEHSPNLEANNHSDIQEIPRVVWNPTFHNRVQKNPSLVPVPGQMNPVHNFLSYTSMIYFNIIFPSMPTSS